MTNEVAKFWLAQLEPLLVRLHRHYGERLNVELDDLRQDAWMIAFRIAPTLDADQNVLAYVRKSVVRHVVSQLHSTEARKLREARWAKRNRRRFFSSYVIDDELNLRELARSMSDEELRLVELMNMAEPSEGAEELGVGMTTYYKRTAAMARRIEGVLEL